MICVPKLVPTTDNSGDFSSILSLSSSKKFRKSSKNSVVISLENDAIPLTDKTALMCAAFGKLDPRYYLTVKSKNSVFVGLIDTGSSRTYVNQNLVNNLGEFTESNASMVSANNNVTDVDGEALVTYKLHTFKKNRNTLNKKANI